MSNTNLREKITSLVHDIQNHLSGGYRTLADENLSNSHVRKQQIHDLIQRILHCRKCPLHQSRTHAVPGFGVMDPQVLVIGEAPGADEDRRGEPFVGRSGRYLDQWLTAIHLSRRKNVYITNMIKCRPPANRDPTLEEKTQCNGYLTQQIELLRPRFILCVGRIAAQYLLQTVQPLGTLRKTIHSFGDIPVVVTYHPSGVLRNPSLRRNVWDDLKMLRSLLDDH